MDVVTLALAKKSASGGEKGDKGDKGDTGVGVKSITSTNNTADGGTSVITVTLTDGSKSTFNVKNGSKGSTGSQGKQGIQGIQGEKGDTYTLTQDDKNEIVDMVSENSSKVLSSIQTTEGTIVSQNADFAEVAEWADGNPNNEDRVGYFVCANVPVNGIVMKKATSIDDVKGVTILAPAFAGNYTKDKLDSKGNLLSKYSYVAIIGFVPVIDNGTCTVGGRCMPDDNGCAVPSSNSMGYQVVNRIDENRVLIIIEPNGDMVQRVKTKINQLQEDIGDIDTALDSIIAIQENYIGGDSV